MGTTLQVGLSSWVIQDGNYGEFKKGRKYSFALEYFAPVPLTVRHHDAQSKYVLSPTCANAYDITADVSFIGDQWLVLDAGIKFYEMGTRSNWKIGGSVRGNVLLAIDPFSYFESLSFQSQAPALIYDWEINRIELETTPWIETGPKYFEQVGPRSWRDVMHTDAWGDDEGRAQYLLTCTLTNDQPRVRA